MSKVSAAIKGFTRRINFKSTFGTIVLLVLFAVITSAIGYGTFTSAMLEQYAKGAFRTADAASTLIDGDDLEGYLSGGPNSEEYETVEHRLRRMCNATGSTFIYVIVPDTTDYGHITFVFSTVNRDSPYIEFEFGYVRETTNDDYRSKYAALYSGTVKQALVVRDQGYIPTNKHITAMVPLIGDDGTTKGIVCVQYQMDALYNARMEFINLVVLAMLILLVVVIIVQEVYLNRLLLRPIKTITHEASRFATENTPAEKKLSELIPNQDEIGVLAGSVDQMEEQIQEYVENLTRATAKEERIRTELAMAASIQTSMLPNVFPPFPQRHEFDLYASMDPAREVGGDFYDFVLIDEDHLALVIADVSGKGVPAALFMVACMTILKNNARFLTSPAQLLKDSNMVICSNNKEEMFISVWLGILEISTGILTAANAGHEYPAIRKADGKFEILEDPHGLVLGAMENVSYKDYKIRMEPGSKIFVYTDGVPEAADSAQTMFGMERMLDALNKDPDASPEQILHNVREAVDSFVREAEQFDDLTMLCMEYKGTGKE